MPMSPASGMQEALREVVGKEIMVVVISQCESFSMPTLNHFQIVFPLISLLTPILYSIRIEL